MNGERLGEVQTSPEECKEVTIQRAGKSVRGNYYISDGQVTVAAWTGTKTARLGTLPVERSAHVLLRKLTLDERSQKMG
jgi:hypothetical protein